MPTSRRLLWALALIAASIAIFTVPAQWEGPVLLRISADHAIAALDAVAIATLFLASLVLYWGLWRDRLRLREVVQHSPGTTVAASFAGGTGLGLLFASVFSEFSGWWIIGAFVFSTVVIAAAWSGGRRGNTAA